jgi:hypothetical protein
VAASDARPIPRRNVAYRVTFPILNNTGSLVTGAAGLDSEVSKDAGAFADCTNEATEIATSSGMYYLDLTAAEMDADTVAIIVKTSTTDAKTTPIVIYPEEAGDVRADMVMVSGDATAADNLETMLDGTGGQALSLGSLTVSGNTTFTGTTTHTGNASYAAGITVTQSTSNGHALSLTGNGTGHGVRALGGTTGYGASLEAGATSGYGIFIDGSGNFAGAAIQGSGSGNGVNFTGGATGAGAWFAGGATSGDGILVSVNSGTEINADITGNITGNLSGSVGSVTGAVGSVTGNVGGNVTGSVGSVTGAVGSVTGAVGSVTGNVGGNVTGSVGSVAAGGITSATFAAGAINAAAIATGAIDADALAADAAAEIVAAVWDEPTAGNVTAGTFGAAVVAAGSAGDPWSTSLPGAYGAGTAGKIIGDNINATISSRSTYAGADTAGTTTLLGRIPGTVQPQTGDAFARLGAPAGASVSADVAAVKTDTGNLVTRITATLFSGITSMAQWLGLLAGKQVGNATARTELRATGAGAGTYDEITDSQEAIRDRGDAAWTTGAGGPGGAASTLQDGGGDTLLSSDTPQ